MIRLIAADLDGTLLDAERGVSENTKAALNRALARGIEVVLATGRTYEGVRGIYEGLGLNGPVIVNNGALVYHPIKNQVIDGHPLSSAEMVRILSWLDEEKLYYQFYTKDKIFTRRLNFISKEWVEKNKSLPENQRIRIEVLGDGPLPDITEEDPFYKLLVMDDSPEVIKRVKAFIGTFPELRTTVSIENGVDIMRGGVSKGSGLQHLCEALGIAPQEVMAFGDQENDLEMLRYAGIGVAMANASDHVKAVAQRVAPLHHEDGLARFLDDYFETSDSESK